MYVRDTFLSSVDRLSAKSILTSKTGTLLGVLASLLFIAIAFVIFLGPVIMYFKGDYTQGGFQALSAESLQLYTGCDFKIAVFFYQKSTGKLINHTATKDLLSTRILYSAPDKSNYYANALPCRPSYFAQMPNKPHQFNPEDCFIAPDGLGFLSKLQQGYLSVFGFQFEPICNNPFMCSTYEAARSNISTRRSEFFNNHYFVLRFTTQQIDDRGRFVTKFNQMYSTQWDSDQSTMPVMWASLQAEKVYLDDSVMPWMNNKTRLSAQWYGVTNGQNRNTFYTQSKGIFALISIMSKTKVIFREYKKIDWLLGMLGGGILALFLIFWLPCHFLSFMKTKLQNCHSTVLVQSQISNDQTQTPNFRICWYLSNILPFKLKCFQRQNKIIQQSERILDVSQILKKMKVALKNLQLQNKTVKFEQRELNFDEQKPQNEFSQQQLKYELQQKILSDLKNNAEIPNIYMHCQPMLSICSLAENRQLSNKYLANLKEKKNYSTKQGPNLDDEEDSKCGRTFKKIGQLLSRFLQLFDVFGAKPNLIAPPHNFSVFGCFITFLIIFASILTFALTIKNMSVVRTYWDQIFIPPQQHSIKMTTGSSFRAVVCFPETVFKTNLVTGSTRLLDLRFFQYRRNGSVVSQQYFPTQSMVGEKIPYFDNMDNPIFSNVNLTFCFRPQKDHDVEVYGDADSDYQASIGFKLTPTCLGTPSYCNSIENETKKNFFGFISNYSIFGYVQDSNYYLDQGKVLYTPQGFLFSSAVAQGSVNFTRSAQVTLIMSTLQLIDDWVNWVLGSFPSPKQQVLSADLQTLQARTISVTTRIPHLIFRFTISGRLQRVIFSSYKIDFLFAIIGGCFVLYYFQYGLVAKAFNSFKVKSKLAEILYKEKPLYKNFIAQLLRLDCCKNSVIKKIQNDLDATNLAKNVDNIYQLSASNYSTLTERNLALIYLKQGIKYNDSVIVQQVHEQQPEQIDEDISFYSEYNELQQQKNLNKNKEKDDEIFFQDSVNIEKQQFPKKLRQEKVSQVAPTTRKIQKCGPPLGNLDFFHTNAQLTFEGKRTVKSIMGGLFCIGLVVFIVLLTIHFLKIYFSDFNRVSQRNVVNQDSDARSMRFKIGQNFKLVLSFTKVDDYDFLDVSNIVKDVGLSIVKYKFERTSNKTTVSVVNLQKCSSNYLDGFLNAYDSVQYFKRLPYAYCIPDETELNLYGSTDDNIREYFSLQVYNKHAGTNLSQFGNQKVIELLTVSVPRYFISSSLFDYKSGKLRYQMVSKSRYSYYSPNYSLTVNTTIIKTRINFDTAVNPSNQIKYVQSYHLRQEGYYLENIIRKDTDRYFHVNFYAEQMLTMYTVQKYKANQIFGIIGGCIAFLFFGFGCLPRSYNQFQMRYRIGANLYAFKSKRLVQKKKSGDKKTAHHELYLEQQLSGVQLFGAWILSYWAFITNNYEFCYLMKRYSIIQSRVTKDLNIYHFMKNLYACQSAINNSAPFNRIEINLCRAYAKKIVGVEEEQYQSKRQFKSDVQKHKDLVQACRVNKFTQWELYNIFDAKQKKQKINNIFKQKWLDKYFAGYRKSVSMQSQIQKYSGGDSDSKSSQGRRRRRKKAQGVRSINSASSLKSQDAVL